MRELGLLARCAAHLGGTMQAGDRAALLSWHAKLEPRVREATERFLSLEAGSWDMEIFSHRAHTHAWYDHLAQEIDIDGFATFLLENRHFPAFIPMLERIREVQVCDQGRRAVQANIDDEHAPVPHAQLMRRLMEATRRKASPDLQFAQYPSLVDRTLVFYYGYYLEPWHLVGSLFGTELMGVHRVTHMGTGLRRLGIDEEDLEFVRIHSECDDDHAREWRDDVILPSIAQAPEVKETIATGIAQCLETSAEYLDDLLSRECSRRSAARVSG